MQPTQDIIGVIPARLASTRLPRKPLLRLAGTPMVQRVYEGARRCRALRQVVVATDADEIAAFCREQGIPVEMTSSAHVSGTDRVHEVLVRSGAQAAVNIQGDEPMIRPEMLDTLVAALFSAPDVEVATLCTPMSEDDEQQPSAVKVVTDLKGNALYFSRAPIPFPREGRGHFRKHLGLYAYTRAALDRFHNWPVTELETLEKLEQLRFLANGVSIAVAETPFDSIGIDTAEDVERVEALLNGR